MKLTSEQLAIIRHCKGPALVTAGAGCGKTTVLVEYIVRKLREQEDCTKKILVLTFSKSACEEIRHRLEESDNASNVIIKTYDAFCYGLVGQYHDELGFSKPPTLLDNTELFSQCIKDVKKRRPRDTTELMKQAFDVKGRIANGQPVVKTCQKNPLIEEVLQLYQKRKKNENLVDFSDMVGLLTKNNSRWLEKAAGVYRYLLVDELQDTSVLQTKMLVALAENIETSIMVGDPKQNINGFRGAFAKNWDTIKDKLQPQEYPLTQSQRLPAPSLAFVNAIGDEIYPGAKLSSDVKGQTVRLITCKTMTEQSKFIANKIKWLLKSEKARPEQIACLGRTQRSLSDLAVALEKHGIIAHELYREPQRRHEIGLRNLLRLTRNLRRFTRNLQQPGENGFEFPEKRRKAFTSLLKRLGLDTKEINNIFKKMPEKGWKAVSIQSWANGKESSKYRTLIEFKELIAQAVEADELEKAISYLMDALRKVLRKDNRKRTLDFLMRDLTQLKIKIRQFSSWKDLSVDELQLNTNPEGIQLSTINGAKGKEWRYVFLIHCVDGMLPIHYAKTDLELKSEKMLFYVAITRHQKALYLMDSPASRVIYNPGKNGKGRQDKSYSDRSSFISDREKHLRVLDVA